MPDIEFTAAGSAQRLAGLLDPGSQRPVAGLPAADVMAAQGTAEGRPVLVAALDSRVAGGSIGVAECDALVAVFAAARHARLPVVLLLDSAGARLQAGVAGLGAFRRLYRAMLDAVAEGIALLAITGRSCFGGASMLAAAADRCVFTASTRFAMSGPGVIEAIGGRAELDASDREAVRTLMGGEARAAVTGDALVADSLAACRGALVRWLAGPHPREDASGRHRVLGERLARAGVAPVGSTAPWPPAFAARVATLLPDGAEGVLHDGVVQGTARLAGATVELAGIVEGHAVTAARAWLLAGRALAAAERGRSLVVLYDCPGHALTRFDESLVLSAYVAHVAQSLDHCARGGYRVSTVITGEASGGIYVALAAPAREVVAVPGADVRILPKAAVARVLGAAPAGDAGPGHWTALGLADRVAEHAGPLAALLADATTH